MKLTGRTVLITGGTSGIGLELAARLLARDNVVIVTGRDDKGIDAAKSRHPALHAFKSDVGDAGSIRQLHADVTGRFPQLDTLVNNAGIMRNLKLGEERSLEDVTREIDIDLSGPIRMVQQFLPHLRRRSDALIVMVSSGIAFVPFSIAPVYSAAKAGLRAYTRCLRTQKTPGQAFPPSTWNTFSTGSGRQPATTAAASAWGSPSCRGSSSSTAAGCGRRAPWVREAPSPSRSLSRLRRKGPRGRAVDDRLPPRGRGGDGVPAGPERRGGVRRVRSARRAP